MNSLASQTLTRGGERVWSTAIYRSVLHTPKTSWPLTCSDDVCGRDVQIRCRRTTGSANANNYYTSVCGHHIREHRQNKLTPQKILGVLGTDLYVAVAQTLYLSHVEVWLARL